MIDFERQQFFWSRVTKDGDHLLWTGSKGPRDYGIMYIGEKNDRVYAHRVSYCIAKHMALSDIENFTILHTCERHDCVSPDHLVSKPRKAKAQNRDDADKLN